LIIISVLSIFKVVILFKVSPPAVTKKSLSTWRGFFILYTKIKILMKKRYYCLSLCLFVSSFTNAQQLVSSEYLTSRTQTELTLQFFSAFNNGVDLYKILYTTTDINGQPDTASGLLIVPDEPEFVYPLLCYQHGTVDSRWDVPSELAGGYELAMALSGKGYVVVAPDYLGLGEARGLHPYVHAETEARAAIDMLYAAREYDEAHEDVSINEQLFLTGYSQGGHAAFAAHKYLQQNFSDDFTVTASAPMSGPYSVSEKMIDFTLGDQEYGFVAYIAWTSLSYNLAAGGTLYSDLNEVFKAPYVPYITQFANEEITLNELNEALIATLLAENGPNQMKPKLMVQDDVLDGILNDPNHPFSLALAENDLIDWLPVAPTRLVACANDDQVTAENAIYTADIMNNNGATDLATHDPSPSADHGGCVIPATLFVVDFFQQYQQITPILTSVESISKTALVNIQPNPADDFIHISLSDYADKANTYELRLFTSNGVLLGQSTLSGSEVREVSTAGFAPGFYLLQVVGEEGSFVQKVVVR
jgi:Secretion system C-terminal sorting domain/Secretory lipase